MPTFNDISPEIKALILEHLPRPSDLKNICLVNKQLHELAVKPLYHSVQLDLGSEGDNRLSAFLRPSNIGLQYIRRVRLYLAAVPHDCNQEQQVSFVIRMLLEFLPEDVLEEFTWSPWKPFSAENLLLLYQKQRKMKWLEVMDLDGDILSKLKKSEKLQANIFQPAKMLALYPENRKSLRLAGYFVEKTAHYLEDLAVHTGFAKNAGLINHTRNVEYFDPRELNDSATAPGLLTSTIFAHMLPFDKCEPFKYLKAIRLDSINLRHCETTWCKVVNFTEIESLRIQCCPGADAMLSQLSKAANLPKKLRSFQFQHVDNPENDALLALDGFLCLTSGIESLILDLKHVDTMPAAAGIARHGKTLGLLSVHGSPAITLTNSSPGELPDELIWNPEAFTKICESCGGLEQLSCAWPTTSIVRAPNDEWEHYETEIADLKNLVTIRISNYPIVKPTSGGLPRKVYQQLLQGLATRLFEEDEEDDDSGDDSESNADDPIPDPDPTTTTTTTHAPQPDPPTAATQSPPPQHSPSKLRLIAFGISNRIYEREDSQHQLIYLRSTALDAENKPQRHATPISWCLRKFVEPRSDILDIVLLRACKLPWAGGGSGRGTDVNGLGWRGDEDE